MIDGPSGHTGLRMTTSGLLPRQNGAIIDNTIDLGSGAYRYNDLYLGGNLYIGGTGSANALDDYEEGTFTPTIDGDRCAASITCSSVIGQYTKVGRMVNCGITYTVNAVSGGASNLAVDIGGLPFTTNASANVAATIRSQNLASAVEGVQVILFGTTMLLAVELRNLMVKVALTSLTTLQAILFL